MRWGFLFLTKIGMIENSRKISNGTGPVIFERTQAWPSFSRGPEKDQKQNSLGPIDFKPSNFHSAKMKLDRTSQKIDQSECQAQVLCLTRVWGLWAKIT